MTRIEAVFGGVERVKGILAGLAPEVQGAILTECFSIWLAGHHVEGDEGKTRTLREELLNLHWFTVRDLIPINAKELGTTQ